MGIIKTKLDEKLLKEIKERAEELSLDTEALVKKLIVDGIKQIRMERYLTLYEEGEISLEELAQEVHLSIYEVLLVLKRRKIPIGSDYKQTQRELSDLSRRLGLST